MSVPEAAPSEPASPPSGPAHPPDFSTGPAQHPVASALTASNPWPGLDYYTEETAKYFHGRSEEAEELLSRVRRRRVTVLYGQSGLGKSSVLQAGLFPMLKDEGWFPIYIRLRYRPESLADHHVESLLAQTLRQIGTAITAAVGKGSLLIAPSGESTTPEAVGAAPPEALAAELPRAGETLREYLLRRRSLLRDGSGRPVALTVAFDQFEEIFTLGRTNSAALGRNDFVRELAYCVENEMSAAERTIRRDGESDGDGTNPSGRSWQSHFRFIISLREDFLAQLNELGIQMPTLLENQMRLSPMDGWKALQAVAIPGKDIIEPLVARDIVRYVAAQVRDDEAESETKKDPAEIAKSAATASLASAAQDYDTMLVDPAILSMACRELNSVRAKNNEPKVTSALVEELLKPGQASLFRRFYDESFPVIAPSADGAETKPPPAKVRLAAESPKFTGQEAALTKRYIEDRLLEGKRRVSQSYTQATQDLLRAGLDDPDAVFQNLVNRRLLRISPKEASMVIELTHDVLCDPVSRSREERKINEKREDELRARELQRRAELKEQEMQRRHEVERRHEAERKLQIVRREKRFWIAMGALAAVVVVLLVVNGMARMKKWQQNAIAGKKLLERATKAKNPPYFLEYLSAAIRSDPENREAAKQAWQTIATKIWCWPISPPLRSDKKDEDPMIAGSFSVDSRQIVAVTQNGRLLAASAAKGFDKFSEIDHSGEIPATSSNTNTVSAAFISNDRKRIIFRGPRRKTVSWVWVDGKAGAPGYYQDEKVEFPELGSGTIRSATWSPDGVYLFVFLYSRSETTGYALRREKNEYKNLEPISKTVNEEKISAADFDSRGEKMATVSSDGFVKVWNIQELLHASESGGKESAVEVLFKEPNTAARFISVVFRPDGNLIATTSYHGSPYLIDVATKAPVPSKNLSVQDVLRINFSPVPEDPRICVTKMDGTATIWDTKRDAPAAEPMCHHKAVWLSSFSDDGKKVLTLSGISYNIYDTARVWNVEDPGPFETAFTDRLKGKMPSWLPDLAEAITGLHPLIEDDDPQPEMPEVLADIYADSDRDFYEPLLRRFSPPKGQR